MRWTKRLFGGISTSTLVAAAAVLGAGGIGCADETFKCCECAFVSPPECLPVDPNLMPMSIRFCACPSEGFTYEECGAFCARDVPAAFVADPVGSGLASDPPLTCTPGAKTPIAVTTDPGKTYAKNSCSIGSPVGE